MAFNQICTRFGHPDIDLFASRVNHRCQTFVAWHRDPDAFAIDAFTPSWKDLDFYTFPPFSMILRVLRKIITDRAKGVIVVPYWPSQLWHPMFSSLLAEPPIFLSPDPHLFVFYLQESTSLVEQSYPGIRALIREALAPKNIPSASFEVVYNSVSQSTLKQYDVGLRRWWIFCKTNNITVFAAPVTSLLSFLTAEFERGAIALLLGPQVGQNPLDRRFVKGVFNLHPSRPRYSHTWDPAIVLDLIKSLGSNESLDLYTLSYKLATLLALVTAHRVQTFSLIYRNITFLFFQCRHPYSRSCEDLGTE